MSKFLRHFGLFCMATFVAVSAIAQTAGTVKGTVKNSTNAETLTAVTVSLKGSSNGTYTSDKGTFTLPVSVKPPFTLVFSSVGFESKEVNVTDFSNITVNLKPSFVLGSEVVVAASRVSERILESPVTIERINTNAIKSAPATNYYDILANLKGVDVVAASLTFKSISTRGFNGSGNTRLNQLIDGMDNQAPGLNFSVGSVIGLTELDVDNIELLPGASSALYGAGGMNGTVLINSKNPFKYQGLSFQVKQGVKDVDNYQRPQSGYQDYAVRFAQKVGNRLAYKIGFQYMEAQDWLANSTQNYSRTTGTQNGEAIGGTRYHDPNYDGVNIYGDETTSTLSGVFDGVRAGIIGQLTSSFAPVYGAQAGAFATGAFNQLYGATASFNSLSRYAAFLGSQNAALAPFAPILYGNAKGYFSGVNVSRTGYNEIDVINPTTKNIKLTGAVHYKINDDVEASISGYTGQGNTVYTGSDRYSLQDLKMSQFKFELKAKDWFIRAYTTLENSGNSFNSTIAARYFNEAWKSSSTWYPTYAGAFTAARDAGLDNLAAHAAARTQADAGRPTGNITQDPRWKSIVSTPISKGGALFLDRTSLYVAEGQYNLTNKLGLDKYNADFIVGASHRQYWLDSKGTLFADTAGKISIMENGAYAQLSKRFLDDFIKFSVSGRYDKNQNFEGRFTPRFTMVVKLAEDQNLRFSYQTAYRFPTTQNQWINLAVGGGTRLMGGLRELRTFNGFINNPAYSLASVQAFGASVLRGAPNPGLLKEQAFGEFKPESLSTYEIGYKALVAKKLMVDFYAYAGNYKNFITSVTVLQSRTAQQTIFDLLDPNKRTAYSISTNADVNVSSSGWGLSLDYILPRNFTASASVSSDEIGNLPNGFISYFNTPKMRVNVGLNNSGFLLKDRLGFGATFHYQDGFIYEGTFGVGKVSSFNTLDAVLTYKVPKIKSMVKVGGTNIMNHYYRTAFGNPSIGGLYYVSFAYNIL